jgi:hypothetical protein
MSHTKLLWFLSKEGRDAQTGETYDPPYPPDSGSPLPENEMDSQLYTKRYIYWLMVQTF